MRPRYLISISLALAARLALAEASNWPQFRGPAASGVEEGFPTPASCNADTGENIAWKAAVPGLSHASPIIWDDIVYVATAVTSEKADLKVGLYGDITPLEEAGPVQWRLLAFSKTDGKPLFDALGYEGNPRLKRHPKSSHCNCTPATDGRHIAAIFASEGLFCFDMKGKLLWKKDLGPMDSGFYVVPSAQWGFASSPIIRDGRVIVLCDVEKDSFLAAFDVENGHEVWRVKRNDVPTWGTPAVAESPGRKQIIVNGWHHIGGYDWDTGKELWKLNGGGDIPVPTPVIAYGLAFLTSAHGNSRPMRAIRLDAQGDITPPEIGDTNAAIAWAYARQGNYMQTPIVVGSELYGCTDSGVLSCWDARSGKPNYSERLGNGDQGFTASPVASDSKIYLSSEVGNVFVVAAGSKFSILATNRLAETCMASPALSAGRIFFRTRDHLVAVGSRP